MVHFTFVLRPVVLLWSCVLHVITWCLGAGVLALVRRMNFTAVWLLALWRYGLVALSFFVEKQWTKHCGGSGLACETVSCLARSFYNLLCPALSIQTLQWALISCPVSFMTEDVWAWLIRTSSVEQLILWKRLSTGYGQHMLVGQLQCSCHIDK